MHKHFGESCRAVVEPTGVPLQKKPKKQKQKKHVIFLGTECTEETCGTNFVSKPIVGNPRCRFEIKFKCSKALTNRGKKKSLSRAFVWPFLAITVRVCPILLGPCSFCPIQVQIHAQSAS